MSGRASSEESCSAHGGGDGGGDVPDDALVAGEVDAAVDVDDAGVEEGGLPKCESAEGIKEVRV